MAAWQTILLAFGGNAALIAVLGLLGKSLLEKLITRDTIKFQAELQAKADATIERLKSELQIQTIEHQERFSRLHEKRATVVAELYGHLVEALWAAESFLSPMEWAGEPKKEDKHRDAMNRLVDLYRYFDKHRIFIPADIGASLEKLIIDVRRHVVRFGTYVRYTDAAANERTYEQKNKAWDDGWDAIKEKIPPLRQKLEVELRKLLGDRVTETVQ
jgi:hypothetical protein